MMQTLKLQGGLLGAGQVRQLLGSRAGKLELLMVELLRTAAGYASPPISGYSVGAVAAGMPEADGTPTLYVGANLEHDGEPLDATVHAEQAAVFNAWAAGETGISAIATTAAPCGYCRQFLWELSTASKLVVWRPAARGVAPQRHRLSDLLPGAFGPTDLGLKGGLMSPIEQPLQLATDDPLAEAAAAAARRSYAPYSETLAGCAIQTGTGRTIAAPYAENAAFNPSVSPLIVALAIKNIREPESSIEAATLVESSGKISHRATTERLLRRLAPDATLRYFLAPPA
jgi:cytidine deaminase